MVHGLHRVGSVVLLLSLVAGFGTAEEKRPEPAAGATPEQVSAWIEELGSEDFQEREAAQGKLLAAGEPAVRLLQEAVEKTQDAETRLRASRILKEVTAKPRIQAALRDLELEEWTKVQAALEVLWDEYEQDHGGKEALEKAGAGSPRTARLVQEIKAGFDQLKQVKKQWEQYMLQTGENTQFQEQMQKQVAQMEGNLKRRMFENCKREIAKGKQHAPLRKEKVPVEAKTQAAEPGVGEREIP